MADKIKIWIPNLITISNLFSGCIAIQYAYLQDFRMAAIFVFIGAFFDFFDGFIARLLHVTSEIGKQLDSLADIVTFGVAPGMIVFNYFLFAYDMNMDNSNEFPYYLTLTAFAIPIFSAIRLAVFNLDKTQSNSFKGLPTPANGLFFSFFCYFIFEQNNWKGYGIKQPIDINLNHSVIELLLNEWILVIFIILFSFLMVSNLRLFALKFKTFELKGNEMRYMFLTFALVLLIIFHFRAIPMIVILYILLSLISKAFKLN